MNGSGGPGTSGLPQMVSIASIVLIVGGALGVLGGLAVFGLGGVVASVSGVGALGLILGLLTMALGAAEVWVGLQVRRLTAKGLQYGLLVSYVSIGLTVLNALTWSSFSASTIISLAIPGFVIWALNQNKGIFTN